MGCAGPSGSDLVARPSRGDVAFLEAAVLRLRDLGSHISLQRTSCAKCPRTPAASFICSTTRAGLWLETSCPSLPPRGLTR